ncbi:MAG: WD40/YVTN/BNR-like repeat-containing protein, partial [Blastocatellia bacterium]
TRDGGKNWANVTPPDLKSWMKVSLMDAGHFDNDTAYAAINTLRLDDLRPHIYRTHDGGKTWKHITSGIPNGTTVNVVREDPQRKGLLFAGTEQTVFVSFDDGENWQSLRLNLPGSSVRDLVIKDDDIVVGTHGRSFWILDDITPLRQLTAEVANSAAFMYKPQTAIRVRRSNNTDTPIPPEEPMGQNPPDGAILNYWLKSDAKEVTLEVLGQAGRVIRRYSSLDKPDVVDPKTQAYPEYWFRAPRVLSAKAGMQRWTWDLRHTPPEGFPRAYPMTAIVNDTPPQPDGPLVSPGDYQIRLTVDGKSFTQSLTVKMDPRVSTPQAGLAQIHDVAMRCYDGITKARTTQADIRKLRDQLKSLKDKAGSGIIADAITALDQKASAIEGAGGGGRFGGGGGRGGGGGAPSLSGVAGEFSTVMNLVDATDMPPTTQAVAATSAAQRTLADLIGRWDELKSTDVKALNDQLSKANLPTITQ